LCLLEKAVHLRRLRSFHSARSAYRAAVLEIFESRFLLSASPASLVSSVGLLASDDLAAPAPPVAAISVNATIAPLANAPSNFLIPSANNSDFTYDATRNRLYIVHGNSTIERYDLTSQQYLPSWTVNGALTSADISFDGSTLYLADSSNPVIHSIHIDSGAVTDYAVSKTTYSLCTLANGDVMFNYTFNADHFGVYRLHPATDTVTTVGQLGSGSGFLVRDGTHTYALGSGNDGNYRMHILTNGAVTSQFVLPNGGGYSFNDLGISRDGSLTSYVNAGTDTVDVYNVIGPIDFWNGPPLVHSFTGSGAFFDPTRDVLYVANGSILQAYDTLTWLPLTSVSIGESVSPNNAFNPGYMQITPDGKQLFINTSSGIRVVGTPTDFYSPTLTLSAPATAIHAGNPVTLTANISDAAQGFTPSGTVTFYAAYGTVASYTSAVILGTSPLAANGSAVLGTTAIPGGASTVFAMYSGDTHFMAASSNNLAFTATVVPVPVHITLQSPIGRERVGSTLTFNATVSADNGDSLDGATIRLESNGEVVAQSTVANGTATFTVSETAGTFQYQAYLYNGNAESPVFDPANGSYYLLVSDAVTWSAARTLASSSFYLERRGTLASINTADENAFVYNIAGGSAWLGGYQPPGSFEPAGGWTWTSGEPFTYADWAKGEPDNANGGESYLQFWDGSQWNDAGASVTCPYVIEFAPGAPQYLFFGSNAVSVDVPTPASNTLTLSASASTVATGTPVTLTTSFTGVPSGVEPTGTVTFYATFTAGGSSNSYSLGTSTIKPDGSTTLTTATFPINATAFYAIYSGDGDFATSQSNSFPVTSTTVSIPVNISLQGPSGKVRAGSSMTFTATVSADNVEALNGRILQLLANNSVVSQGTIRDGTVSFQLPALAGSYQYQVALLNPTPTSPQGSMFFDSENGSYYEFVTSTAVPWYTARDIAASRTYLGRRGYLASINSADENTFIWNTWNTVSSGTAVWLGGYQPPGSPEPAGGWSWASGEPFSYTNWNPGEPNNAGGEDALTFWSGGTWNDTSSADSLYFVVEYAPDAAPYADATSNVLSVAVPTPIATTLTISTDAADVVALAPVTLTATFSGMPSGSSPTGKVMFYGSTTPLNATTTLGSADIAADGTATLTLASLPIGVNQIYASYDGDLDFAPQQSGLVTVTVTKASSSLTLSVPVTTITDGDPLLAHVQLTVPANAFRTVSIIDQWGNVLASGDVDATGAADFSFNPGPNVTAVKAVYAGDSFTAPAQSASIPITKAKAAYSLTLSLKKTSIDYGAEMDAIVHVKGSTGRFQIYLIDQHGNILASAFTDSSGNAHIPFFPDPTITAVHAYLPGDFYTLESTSDPVNITVAKAPTVLQPTNDVANSIVRVYISGGSTQATGPVHVWIYQNGHVVDQGNIGDSSTNWYRGYGYIDYSQWPAGNYHIVFEYDGDNDYLPARPVTVNITAGAAGGAEPSRPVASTVVSASAPIASEANSSAPTGISPVADTTSIPVHSDVLSTAASTATVKTIEYFSYAVGTEATDDTDSADVVQDDRLKHPVLGNNTDTNTPANSSNGNDSDHPGSNAQPPANTKDTSKSKNEKTTPEAQPQPATQPDDQTEQKPAKPQTTH
jgi:hypothetical protein